ncbi:MAG: hypothetical protein V2A34_06340 [Lentisphaerota bacterium]
MKFFPIIGKIAALLLFASPAMSAEMPRLMGTNEHHHLDRSLSCLNMTERDLAFEKDVGRPWLVLERNRQFLKEPLRLPPYAERVAASLSSEDPCRVWNLAQDVLNATNLERTVADPAPQEKPLDPDEPLVPMASALQRFSDASQKVRAMLKSAFGGLSEEERRYLAASYLGGLFNAEDREPVRNELLAMGVTSQDVQHVIAEGLELDPEPVSTNWLRLVQKIDLPQVLEAGRVFQEAVRQVESRLRKNSEWPKSPVRYGDLVIGALGNDRYTESAALIFDPGGDDLYAGEAGSANGLKGAPLSAIVDLAGDDRYEGSGMLGPGSALLGISVLVDGAGDDMYRARYTGQAGAVFGAAWLEDRSGHDLYKAYGHAQGAAFVGLAYFRDKVGNDSYDVGFTGQAFAGVLGVGWLVDDRGNDHYFAGGVEPDYDHIESRFLSLAQGFAIGLRPYIGGGMAALVDLEGSDSYVADIFAQGVSYWYSVGMLLDASGNDTYSVYHYGQGSGIHLSSGLLADGAGDDFYTGFALSQGNAHDYAVGMLFDHSGADTYTSDHYSQGRAINNGLALLVDSEGDDAYFGRHNDDCQGIGNDGGNREYGSLAILMDLSGTDQYSCGATNDSVLLRPSFGGVCDVNSESRRPSDEP